MFILPNWVNAQTNSSNPQQIICGTQALEFYQVDYTENGGAGTTGSTYVWSVSTPLATITNNLGPSSSSNRISIDWSAVLIGSYTVTVVEENANGCAADPIELNVEIIQPDPPVLECWETATFDNSTCQWIVTGTQPPAPTVLCYETATWNPTTCVWDVTGTQPPAPTVLCYETATWNPTSCVWDVTGTPPTVSVAAGPAICYEGSAVFDFSGGPANGLVTFTIDGTQQTVVLDASGEGAYVFDPATADVVLTLISIADGTCVVNVNGTATVQVSPQIITSPISHD